MKIAEIINEAIDDTQELIDDIITSFVSLDKKTLSTKALTDHLSTIGVVMSPEDVVSLVSDHPMVISANVNVIKVGPSVGDDVEVADGNEIDRVSHMADGAVDLGD